MRSLRKLTIRLFLIFAVFSLSSFSDVNPDRENPNDKPVKDASAEYCVFLGVYGEMIPVKEAVIIGNTKGASCKRVENGNREFYSPHYSSEAEANNAILNFNSQGLTNTTVVIYFEGNYYTPSEYAALNE